jgi:hypothetical protein
MRQRRSVASLIDFAKVLVHARAGIVSAMQQVPMSDRPEMLTGLKKLSMGGSFRWQSTSVFLLENRALQKPFPRRRLHSQQNIFDQVAAESMSVVDVARTAGLTSIRTPEG